LLEIITQTCALNLITNTSLYTFLCGYFPNGNQYTQLSCSYNRSQQDALFLNFILVNNSTCFGQTYCPSSGVLILYSQLLVFVILVMLTVTF